MGKVSPSRIKPAAHVFTLQVLGQSFNPTSMAVDILAFSALANPTDLYLVYDKLHIKEPSERWGATPTEDKFVFGYYLSNVTRTLPCTLHMLWQNQSVVLEISSSMGIPGCDSCHWRHLHQIMWTFFNSHSLVTTGLCTLDLWHSKISRMSTVICSTQWFSSATVSPHV